jgi:hypothetical protein
MDLFIFLEKLPRPLGYGPEFGFKDLRSRQKEVATLMLPIYGQDHNLVHFHDVAHALSLRTHEDHAAGRGETLDMLPEGHRINKGWNKVFKSCKTPRSDFDVEMVYCVIQLQRSFRAYRFRKRIAERSSTQNPKQGQQFLRSQISADMSDDEEQLSRHIRPVTPVYNEVHISRNPNAISRAV